MAKYEWQPLHGTEQNVIWRDLRVPRHWAQINPDGSWSISRSKGRSKTETVARGFEGTTEVAKRVIREWEERNR